MIKRKSKASDNKTSVFKAAAYIGALSAAAMLSSNAGAQSFDLSGLQDTKLTLAQAQSLLANQSIEYGHLGFMSASNSAEHNGLHTIK